MDYCFHYSNLTESQIIKFEKEIKFFQENKTCPTCSQNIDDSVKKSKILSNNLEISDIKNKVDLGNKSIKDIEMQNQSLENALKELQKTLDHVKQLNRGEKVVNKSIDIIIATLIANGTHTVFGVGETIDILFNVALVNSNPCCLFFNAVSLKYIPIL
jgi:hypothetical protein